MDYHISIFLENKPGQLEKIMKVLSDNQINLRAMSLASLEKFGIVKLLVDNPAKAFDAYKAQNITITKRKISTAVIDNVPGAFYNLLKKLSKNGINIEDCYGFLLKDGKTAAVVFEIENYPQAEEIIKNLDINILSEEQIYKY